MGWSRCCQFSCALRDVNLVCRSLWSPLSVLCDSASCRIINRKTTTTIRWLKKHSFCECASQKKEGDPTKRVSIAEEEGGRVGEAWCCVNETADRAKTRCKRLGGLLSPVRACQMWNRVNTATYRGAPRDINYIVICCVSVTAIECTDEKKACELGSIISHYICYFYKRPFRQSTVANIVVLWRPSRPSRLRP